LLDKTYGGLELAKQLLAVEELMRSKLVNSDISGQEFLDQLNAQLVVIQARFSKGLAPNTAPTASKKGMLKTTAGGFFGAMFLILLFLLGQKIWINARAGSVK